MLGSLLGTVLYVRHPSMIYQPIYPGLLHPLTIQEEVWIDVSMDLISILPKSGGKDVIFVMGGRLRKYAHFLALSHPYTALPIA